MQLSTTLMGVCSQQLLATPDGRGRVVACEILVPTPAVRHLIRDGQTHQIPSAIQMGGKFEMQTMDAALAHLVRRGQLTMELALQRATDVDACRRLMEKTR